MKRLVKIKTWDQLFKKHGLIDGAINLDIAFKKELEKLIPNDRIIDMDMDNNTTSLFETILPTVISPAIIDSFLKPEKEWLYFIKNKNRFSLSQERIKNIKGPFISLKTNKIVRDKSGYDLNSILPLSMIAFRKNKDKWDSFDREFLNEKILNLKHYNSLPLNTSKREFMYIENVSFFPHASQLVQGRHIIGYNKFYSANSTENVFDFCRIGDLKVDNKYRVRSDLNISMPIVTNSMTSMAGKTVTIKSINTNMNRVRIDGLTLNWKPEFFIKPKEDKDHKARWMI